MQRWTLSALFVFGLHGCFNDNPASYQAIESLKSHRADDDVVQADSGPSDDETTDDETTDDATDDDAEDDDSSDDDTSGEDATDGGATDDVTSDDDDEADASVPVPAEDRPDLDPNSPYYPPCDLGTALNGEEIKKGTQCTADDVQECFRQCGPAQVGWKTETCQAGVYAESDCSFPEDGDYSCYALPDEIDPAICPQDSPPRATEECGSPLCTACNVNGQYFDTADNLKEWYCVCREPDEDGVRRWTCASITAWPCPFSRGC